ncbi:lytic murein transglycosylase B [Shewanella sp. 10N.261.52.F9]|uniref:lytic murein transglycosylase B n=1 Tax=Shewanella sp. 10N.261.52.F9 TaxID=3229684 RepID=UPI0035513DDF
MTLFKRIFAPLALTFLSCSAAAAPTDSDIEKLKSEFIKTQAEKGFNTEATASFIANAEYNQAVIDAMTKPWEAKPWYQYYPIFLTEKRLEKGLAFWNEHADIIDKASKEFNVDPQIIVAIIGIETFYGGYMGNYPVKDALYTLGFHYPPRAKFFRSEFANLQSLVKEENLELNSLKGSYAGAMGFGQFIPSSYRHYAVDFDKDGSRDLLNSKADAIGSVANYFHQHGWQKDQPVTLQLTLNKDLPDTVKTWSGEKLHYKVADILSPDVALAESMDLDVKQPALVVKLEQADNDEYWLGLKNFYVITRYNRSPLYAMAVYQFSQELKKAYATQ